MLEVSSHSFLAQKLGSLFNQVYSSTKNITHITLPKKKKTKTKTPYELLLPIISSQVLLLFFLIAVNTLETLPDLSGIDCKRYLCNKDICKRYSGMFQLFLAIS